MDFPNIDPVAFYIELVPIRWYALAYIAGFLAGWKYCLYLAGLDKEARPNKSDIDDFLPWAILGLFLVGALDMCCFTNLNYMPLILGKLHRYGMAECRFMAV